MGAQRNYTSLIRTILMFKRYWSSIDDDRLKPLKEVLSKFDFVEDDEDWDHVPDNKKVSELLGLPRSTVNKMIFKLYQEITFSFYDKPPKIKKLFHRILIHIPWDDRRYRGLKNRDDEESQYITVSLPVTPHVGETIELDFLDSTKYRRGYIHKVEHTITGYHQEIFIEVHPFENEYTRWQNLKADYERHERIWRT